MRPVLDRNMDIQDFKDFYWLKDELVEFCREIKIPGVGGKIEIANRIIDYLETGKVTNPKTIPQKRLPKSTELLTSETVIGIDYRSYGEKKEFFRSAIGKQFKFTTHLLEYFKQNAGRKTYGDVVAEWHKGQKLRKDPDFVKEIAPQFEYNAYIRDFTKDNPNRPIKDAIKYWNLKKSLRGENRYTETDLELDEE